MFLKGKKGIMLIACYFIIAVIFILSSIFLAQSISEGRIVERKKASIRAFWLAEAGIDKGIWELNYGGGTWSGWDTTGNPYIRTILHTDGDGLSAGDIDISITDPTSRDPQIDAMGYAPNTTSFQGKRRVTAMVEKSVLPAFNYCIMAGQNLTLENIETGVDGDVHSNGDITNEGVSVDGTGTAVGEISGQEYFDDYQEEVDEVEMPPLNMTYYETEATNGGHIHDGDWTVSGEFDISDYSDNGTIYVNGNFKGEGATIVGPGTIVATGTIKIGEDSVVGSEGAIVGLFSNSSDEEEAVKIETDSSCYAVVFAPNGGAKIETESSLYGAVVANDAKIETGSQLVYADGSSDVDLPGSETFSISFWYEQ